MDVGIESERNMKIPITSGQVARLLDTTEPRLNDLIRRRRIDPAPPVVSGRRFWEREHIQQAAEHLGLSPERIRKVSRNA